MAGFSPVGSFPVASTPSASGATLTVTWTVLPDLGVNTGQAITSWQATASAGTPAYTYSIGTGSLPTGLALNTSTGAITGTVTAANGSGFTFTVHAVDALSAFGDSSPRTVVVFDAAYATRKLTAASQAFRIEHKKRHKPWIVPPRSKRRYISVNVAALRITWDGIEAALIGSGEGRVSWSGVEVATPYSNYKGARLPTLYQTHGIIYRPRHHKRQKPFPEAGNLAAAVRARVTWDGVEVAYVSNDPGRVTWAGIEVAYQTNSPGRVIWDGIEVAYLPDGAARNTWSGVEVAYLGSGPARVTWDGAEVAYTGNGPARATWVGIEIATPAIPWPKFRRQICVMT